MDGQLAAGMSIKQTPQAPPLSHELQAAGRVIGGDSAPSSEERAKSSRASSAVPHQIKDALSTFFNVPRKRFSR